MHVYKLVTAFMMSKKGALPPWEIGVRQSVDGTIRMCWNGLHCYPSPEMAVLMDPIHGRYGKTARLLQCTTRGKPESDGTKMAVRSLRPVREVPLPTLTFEQRVTVAILAVKENLNEQWNQRWGQWADKWLSGDDRTAEAAYGAARATACIAAAGYAGANFAAYAVVCTETNEPYEPSVSYAVSDAAAIGVDIQMIIDRVLGQT